MRVAKQITLDIQGKSVPVTLVELTAEQVVNLVDNFGETGVSLKAFRDLLETFLEKNIIGLTSKDLLKMSFSEIEDLFDKWKEVNASFFKISHSLGLDGVLAQVKKTALQDFVRTFYALSD